MIEVKTLEELKLDLIEIQAYRNLQDKDFSFGGNVIKNESITSEDAYYEMLQQDILEQIEYLENQKVKKIYKKN